MTTIMRWIYLYEYERELNIKSWYCEPRPSNPRDLGQLMDSRASNIFT